MNPWLVTFRPRPTARVRMFCLPHAGGAASFFSSWAERLSPAIEACAVQLPGRATRFSEVPFHRLEPLVAALADALLPAIDRPFALFGHSMGALVCFELARRLERTHRLVPEHLFVSGAGAPHLPRPTPRLTDKRDPAIVESIARLDGTPTEVLASKELVDLIAPALRADFAVCETYVYRKRRALYCPITAFGGKDDPGVRGHALKAWAAETRGGLAMHQFEGGHFFLRHAAPAMLEIMQRTLSGQESEEADRQHPAVSTLSGPRPST